MANLPFPLTATDLDETKAQLWEILRQVYEEKVGGAELGDVFSVPGDVLTLVLDDSSGLTKTGNKLAIEPISTGGLQISANGVSIKVVSTGGLETSASGTTIKLDGASLSLSASGLKITPVGSYAVLGIVNDVDFLLGATYAYYLGDATTNGTWRMRRSGDDLIFERRESGSYALKSTIWAIPPP